MKFIKEMIMKKNGPSTLVEAVDSDLQEMRQNQNAAHVPDFTDLVAEIVKSEVAEPEVAEFDAEADDKILAIFENDDDSEDDNEWEDEYAEEDTDLVAKESGYEADFEEKIEDPVEQTIANTEPEPALEEPERIEYVIEEVFDEPDDVMDEVPEDAPAEETLAVAPPKIWNLQTDQEDENTFADDENQKTLAVEPVIVQVPTPLVGRSGRRAGRVKTRLLGFEHSDDTAVDPFAGGDNSENNQGANFPVGWIVVYQGPGRGASFSLLNGVTQIGRGEDQGIKLDFGDSSISRSSHAAIAYDNEQSTFFLGHGGKANLVRLNNMPVLSTEEISNGDLIRIGETTLRFVALCGSGFDWENNNQEDGDDAAIA